VISPSAETLITVQWASQKDLPNDAGTIHIGLQLAEGKTTASYAQVKDALVPLLYDLQVRCNISSHGIYVHRELSDQACGPDPLYPYNWRDALRP
jgi:hypothetical protein